MTRNMGLLDRGARFVVALVLLYLAFGTDMLAAGALFWLALVVALVFAGTAVLGNCPLYSLIGVKTCGTR